jgi:uncharacterized DUF497 family protein
MEEPFPIGPLVWDDWNRDHIAKHGVSADEAQDVADGDRLTLQSYKGRSVLIGRSRLNRILAVVVGPDPNETGAYYCFSARPASRRERRSYQAQFGGNWT